MMQKVNLALHKEPLIWGPISLLCTLAIGVKTAIPFDLLFIAISGLFLCSHWKMRGCVYSLILLGIASIIKHIFLASDHLWQLGLEGSLACAFFMTGFAFQQGASWLESLQSQVQTRQASVENLEEELDKVQQTAQDQQIAFQEKVSTLQKELEDLQSDHSSILILNEVLRRTSARHLQESEMLRANVLELQREKEQLKGEYEALEKERDRIANTDAVAIQNTQLMKELNTARYEKEQTHLINETLARLYARESLKAKEADQEAASLSEQLSAVRREMERIEKPLQEQIAVLTQEKSFLSYAFEKTNREANQIRAEFLKLSEVQTERNFLKERLEAAQQEIALLQNQKPKHDPELAEELAHAQEKLSELSQIEPLYKQLKKQFEEKNQVLHQTRSELFKADTDLQRLKLEQAAILLNPIPKEIEEELHALADHVESLEMENQHLQELICVLSENGQDAAKQKKK